MKKRKGKKELIEYVVAIWRQYVTKSHKVSYTLGFFMLFATLKSVWCSFCSSIFGRAHRVLPLSLMLVWFCSVLLPACICSRQRGFLEAKT